jgi:hypothetical protein
MANQKKQTDANTSEIKTISEAVVRLTTIIEMMQKTPATPAVPTPLKTPFWDTETKKTAIKYSFIFAVILVLALAGINIAETLRVLGAVK